MSDTGGTRTEVGLMLYRSCIRPQLEASCIVWCTAGMNNIRKLESVHRQALKRALGALGGTPTAALETTSGMPPLTLQAMMLELMRIMQKPVSDPLRVLTTSLMSDNKLLESRHITPIHHIKRVIWLLQNKEETILPVQRRLIPTLADTALPTLEHITITDADLGNSKQRTPEQASLARETTAKFIQDIPDSYIITFTDSSALDNPGPCGASAVIFTHGIDHHHLTFNEPISKFGTSYQGELEGIRIALEQTVLLADQHQPTGLHIFTDCQSAITTVSSLGIETSEHLATNTRCRTLVRHLTEKGISCKISWVCGHAGLRPNELADEAAREAAELAKESDIPLVCSEAAVKSILRNDLIEKWQLSWNQGQTARELYDIAPTVSLKPKRYRLSRTAETRLNQLRCGFSNLKDHLYRHGNLVESPICNCGESIQDTRHYLLECALQEGPRLQMIESIERTYRQSETPPSLRVFDIKTLLGGNTELPDETNYDIMKAVGFFLEASRHGV